MAYRIRAGDRSVQRAVRRIAREQIDGALLAIDKRHSDAATHEVRKACKKLRALVRLIRPVFPDHARANAEFRDIARLLSGARDAKVMLDTLELLAGDAMQQGEGGNLDVLRAEMVEEAEHPDRRDVGRMALTEAGRRLHEARGRIDQWVLTDEDWNALGPGLDRILRRTDKVMGKLVADPSALHFHELRKLMKHHWYHTRLLMPLWPVVMQARAAELGRLADLLGLHHDISVLEARWGATSPHGERRKAVVAMLALAVRRRADLEREIRPLAARMIAQKPKALARQWGKWWRIWRDGR